MGRCHLGEGIVPFVKIGLSKLESGERLVIVEGSVRLDGVVSLSNELVALEVNLRKLLHSCYVDVVCWYNR